MVDKSHEVSLEEYQNSLWWKEFQLGLQVSLELGMKECKNGG